MNRRALVGAAVVAAYVGGVAVLAVQEKAQAQTSPGLAYGQVPTAAQWNSYFAAKQDVLGYTPLNTAGGTMTGLLTTTSGTATRAGFNITPGSTPSAPHNGDIWIVGTDFFYRGGGNVYDLSPHGREIASGSSDSAVFPDDGGATIAWNSNSGLAKSEVLYGCNANAAWSKVTVADEFGDAGTHNITVTTAGGTIPSGAVVISTNYGSVTLQCTGATNHWLVIH